VLRYSVLRHTDRPNFGHAIAFLSEHWKWTASFASFFYRLCHPMFTSDEDNDLSNENLDRLCELALNLTELLGCDTQSYFRRSYNVDTYGVNLFFLHRTVWHLLQVMYPEQCMSLENELLFRLSKMSDEQIAAMGR
jgi:hypothetical protein